MGGGDFGDECVVEPHIAVESHIHWPVLLPYVPGALDRAMGYPL
jgi:hypothetical protein